MAASETPPFPVEALSVAVDAAVIDDLRARIRSTRLPEAAPGETWAQGTDRGWLEGLLGYWADGFDWEAAERQLNGSAKYRARIGEAVVHFVHEKARSGNGIPLILGHGWPSCFAELLPLMPLLTDQGGHGINGPAFDVVIPSLPGYGFSTRPDVPGGVTYRYVASLWQQLMRGLGYSRYGAEGGDFGGGIATFMALDDPGPLTGLHLTNLELAPLYRARLPPAHPARAGLPGPSQAVGSGRTRVHRDPVHQAADPRLRAQRLPRRAGRLDPGEMALLERLPRRPRIPLRGRFPAHRGHPVLGHRNHHLLHARLLRQPPLARRAPPPPGRLVRVPTAVAVFPHMLIPEGQPPREWAERLYDIRRWTVMPRGGHFAPAEEPELVARDIAAFYATLDR
jgi:pimeloyl-ACP methyl ester carboxylesterase